MLFLNHQQAAMNTVLYQSKQNSARGGHSRFETCGNLSQQNTRKDVQEMAYSNQALQPAPKEQLVNLQNHMVAQSLGKVRSRAANQTFQKVSGSQFTVMTQKYSANEHNMATEGTNADKSSFMPSAYQQLTDEANSSLLEREQQLQNERYERVLSQKMQSMRYQCKLHLQICAIMSQLNMHVDAHIFGQKSANLCFQLIKDAQLLCKRQLTQIKRQGQGEVNREEGQPEPDDLVVHDPKDQKEKNIKVYDGGFDDQSSQGYANKSCNFIGQR